MASGNIPKPFVDRFTELESIPSNGSKTYTLGINKLYLLFTSGTATTRMGITYIFSRTNGDVVISPILTASAITITVSGDNEITCTNSTNGIGGARIFDVT